MDFPKVHGLTLPKGDLCNSYVIVTNIRFILEHARFDLFHIFNPVCSEIEESFGIVTTVAATITHVYNMKFSIFNAPGHSTIVDPGLNERVGVETPKGGGDVEEDVCADILDTMHV